VRGGGADDDGRRKKMEGERSGSEEEKTLKGLLKDVLDGQYWVVCSSCITVEDVQSHYEALYERAKERSSVESRRGVFSFACNRRRVFSVAKAGEGCSMLHVAAGGLSLQNPWYPLMPSIVLIDAFGIDYKDSFGGSPIMHAAARKKCECVEYLARNKQADLSITIDGDSVYLLYRWGQMLMHLKKRKRRCIVYWGIIMV
jgi:hypothetical protein